MGCSTVKDRFLDKYMHMLWESENIFDCQAVPVDEITDGQDFLFVSYSHRDYREVYADLAVMANNGIKFWYDEGLSAGKAWDEEVQGILRHPNCIGVIFFISENLFLSKSVNQEINLVCGKNAAYNKDYFSVNLSQKLPKNILRSVMRADDAVLDEAGLDMERINALTMAFGDNQTYLSFSRKNHMEELIKEILKQFPSVKGSPTQWELKEFLEEETVCGHLEVNGGSIALRNEHFKIGRDIKWADYCIRDPYVGRRNAVISYDKLKYWITDLGSSNGTRVNGSRIEHNTPILLCDGDVIQIGNECEFIFRDEANIYGMVQGSVHAGKTTYLNSIKGTVRLEKGKIN